MTRHHAMIDIVERLQTWAGSFEFPPKEPHASALLREAADEIARLRALKTPASRELLNITKGCLDDAETDNVRLRTALQAFVDAPTCGCSPESGCREAGRRQAALAALKEPTPTDAQAMTDEAEKPKSPFYYSNEHDQGMGVPARCRCGGRLRLKRLGWTCDDCGTGYGRD